MATSSDVPYKFQYVWAISAAGADLTDPIPATTSTPGAASQQLGWPPLTAQDEGSGGIPPTISDFNGVFKYLSEWMQWVQGGGPYIYDGTLSTNIGGYPKGAIVLDSFFTPYISLIENNTGSPGADWQQLLGAVSVDMTSGTIETIAPYIAGVTEPLRTQYIEIAVVASGSTTAYTSHQTLPFSFPNTFIGISATIQGIAGGSGSPFGVTVYAGQTGLGAFDFNFACSSGVFNGETIQVFVIAVGK